MIEILASLLIFAGSFFRLFRIGRVVADA